MGLYGIDKPDNSAQKVAVGVILSVVVLGVGGWFAYSKFIAKSNTASNIPSQQK